MRLKTSLLIFTMIFFFNCKEEKKENNSEIIDLVNIWNNSHNNKDLASLSNVYAENVFYYGTNQEKTKIIDDKKRLLNKYSNFKQIVSDKDLEITKTENGKSISFTKNVTFNSNQRDYPSYLVVSEINGKWKIVTESDLVTDKNIAKSSKPSKIEKSKKTESEHSETEKLYGDFNGDGKKEYAWIKSPEMLDESYDLEEKEDDERKGLYCIGGCNSVIYFSDKSIVPITIENSFGGSLENFGDLNSDGADNLGVYVNPASITGGQSLNVYNTKENEYSHTKTKGDDYLLIEPIYLRYQTIDYNDIKIVEKINSKSFKIQEAEFDENNGWILKAKIVNLK